MMLYLSELPNQTALSTFSLL